MWLDLLRIIAVCVAIIATILAGMIGIVWFCSKPLGRGPERIVDVKNRGRTRIRMPDGTIK